MGLRGAAGEAALLRYPSQEICGCADDTDVVTDGQSITAARRNVHVTRADMVQTVVGQAGGRPHRQRLRWPTR